MCVPNNDPFSSIDLETLLSDGELKIDPNVTTFQGIWDIVRRISNKDQLARFMALAIRSADIRPILTAICLLAIDEMKLYEWENCSSIFTFCEVQTAEPFNLSEGSVSEYLAEARTLQKLDSPQFLGSIQGYLWGKGKEGGLGYYSNHDGSPKGFRLVDFVGHRGKLKHLNLLMELSPKDIDWDVFFSYQLENYANYVEGVQKVYAERREEEEQNRNQNHARDKIDNSNIPGVVSAIVEEEVSPGSSLMDLDPYHQPDPFSQKEPSTEEPYNHWTNKKLIASDEPKTEGHPKLGINGLPQGCLGNSGIFRFLNNTNDKKNIEKLVKYFKVKTHYEEDKWAKDHRVAENQEPGISNEMTPMVADGDSANKGSSGEVK
ncbi:MAG: hypothetical protein ABSF43_07785 [Rectinemataceae bacterium]|jgi:hypothetical protein